MTVLSGQEKVWCMFLAALQWCNQDFFQDQYQDQDLNFKTKTKILKFFQCVQDQDQDFYLKTKTKTFLWCI